MGKDSNHIDRKIIDNMYLPLGTHFHPGTRYLEPFAKTKILNQGTLNIITFTDSRTNVTISKEDLCVGIQINILRCNHS